jgi:hypothetical protein
MCHSFHFICFSQKINKTIPLPLGSLLLFSIVWVPAGGGMEMGCWENLATTSIEKLLGRQIIGLYITWGRE